MSARTVFKGAINASVLHIGIKLYPTTNSGNDIHFNQLCPDCKVKINQKIVCPSCEKTLARGDCLKGYPIADQFVILTEEEIDKAHSEKTEAISVINFVGQEEVDPLYFDQSYFISPDKPSYELFQVFRQGLIETEKSALGKIVMRSKEHLLLIKPFEKILVAYQLHYEEDLRKLSEIPESDFPQKALDPEMLKLASQLITNLSGKFDPAQYKDEYRATVMEYVEAKANGITIAPTPQKAQAKVTNIMDALKNAVSATELKKAA